MLWSAFFSATHLHQPYFIDFETHAAEQIAAGNSRCPCQLRLIYEFVRHTFISTSRSAAVPELWTLGVMRTPLDKMKKADRALIFALIFCLFMGLVFLGFSVRTYLKHDLQDQTQYDRETLFDVARALVFWLCPCVGAGYLVVGYSIWNYRRKRGNIKDHDKTDA